MLESLVILSSGASFNQYRETIQYAKEDGYQWIEWYLEYYRLPSWKGLRNNFFETIRESNLPFSFHAPVNDVELALKDKNYSRVALDYLKMYIDFLGELAPVNFTIHVGARRIPIEELSWDLAMDNLKGLAEHGFSKNVRVCIENLAHGWAGYPELLMQMAESVDAGITFDIGHARGSPWVQKNYGNVLQFFDIISSRVVNPHVYEYENDKGEHFVPGPGSQIIPVLDKLTEAGCHWWVLELSTYQEIEETLKFIKKHLNERRIRYE